MILSFNNERIFNMTVDVMLLLNRLGIKHELGVTWTYNWTYNWTYKILESVQEKMR